MGLLLRPDAYFARTAEGAHIITHDGELAFAGRTIFPLLDRLAPYLDGRRGLPELTAELPTRRRQLVERVVMALIERSVIKEVEVGRVPEPRPAEGHHEVAFAGYFVQSPVAAVTAYQDSMTLVVGAGRLGAAVVTAAERSGVREVRVATAGPLESQLSGVNLVLHVADQPAAERADLLERLCAERHIKIAHAMVMGGHAWISGIGGWPSGRRRLLAWHAKEHEKENVPARGIPDDLTATVVAGRLVQGVFRAITRAARPAPNRMTRIDLATLGGEEAAFVPHPFAARTPLTPVEDLAARVKRLRTGARLEDDVFSRRAAACMGDRLGLFAMPAEDGYAQSPLHVCEIEISDPVGLLGPDRPAPRVIGAGLAYSTARYQAALRAFACYGSLMVDPRRLGFDRPADPGESLAGLRDGRLTGLVEGYDLIDGDPHLVDAVRVFPALRAQAGPYAPPPGVAAGYSWREAVTRGLLGHCLRLTMDEAMGAAAPFARVDHMAAALDARGERYRALLGVTGEPITVYDVMGTLGVPTMIGYIGGEAAGCAAGLSAADALTETFEQMLLRRQARENGPRAYALPPVRAIPDHLRTRTIRPLRQRAVRDETALAAILAGRGHRPIAVPLDHDPEVNAVMPYIVHVVIGNA
ncbi:YcaO-like family protein [Streptosporangiaceae bacterium NEAU-GS5]|nr:YcaO-like family protein [Streptosporangiaceae bacterium NEAU-GS5]